MSTKMAFMPMLRQFLLDHGEVYTVRKYKMVEKDVEVEEVGLCHRIPMGEIVNRAELLPYVAKSGFPTLEAWWDKIQQFIRYDDEKKYLYHVTRN